MTEPEIEAIARAAGLETALARFKDDLLAAAKAADELRRNAAGPALKPADEPSPAMRTEDGR